MNKKILANLMVCLMLGTIVAVCFSADAKSEKSNNNCSNEESIKLILEFAPGLPPKSCKVSCDGLGGWTTEENGVQIYNFTWVSSGIHKIRFHSGPPYIARKKVVYLAEGESKTVSMYVRNMNSKSIFLNKFMDRHPILENLFEYIF